MRGANAKRPGDSHAGMPCLRAARLYQAGLIAFLTNVLPKLYKDPKLRVVVVAKHRATRVVCVPLEEGLSVDLKSATCADGLNLRTSTGARGAKAADGELHPPLRRVRHEPLLPESHPQRGMTSWNT